MAIIVCDIVYIFWCFREVLKVLSVFKYIVPSISGSSNFVSESGIDLLVCKLFMNNSINNRVNGYEYNGLRGWRRRLDYYTGCFICCGNYCTKLLPRSFGLLNLLSTWYTGLQLLEREQIPRSSLNLQALYSPASRQVRRSWEWYYKKRNSR